MKLLFMFILGVALTVTALNQQIERLTFNTRDRRDSKDVTIKSVTPDALSIETDSRLGRVAFSNLPYDLQKRFGYDATRAAEFTKMQSDLRTAEAKAKASKARELARQRVIERLHTVLEVQSDQIKFSKAAFYLTGTLQISSSYVGTYSSAQKTHYAYELIDKSGSIAHLYMSHGRGEIVRKKLLNLGGSAQTLCAVCMAPGKFEEDPVFLVAELLEVSSPLDNQMEANEPGK